MPVDQPWMHDRPEPFYPSSRTLKDSEPSSGQSESCPHSFGNRWESAVSQRTRFQPPEDFSGWSRRWFR